MVYLNTFSYIFGYLDTVLAFFSLHVYNFANESETEIPPSQFVKIVEINEIA